jgi:hypothetical protein
VTAAHCWHVIFAARGSEKSSRADALANLLRQRVRICQIFLNSIEPLEALLFNALLFLTLLVDAPFFFFFEGNAVLITPDDYLTSEDFFVAGFCSISRVHDRSPSSFANLKCN